MRNENYNTLVANQARYTIANKVKECLAPQRLTTREQLALEKVASEFVSTYLERVLPAGMRPQQEGVFARVLFSDGAYSSLPKTIRNTEALSNLDAEVVMDAMIDGLRCAALNVYTNFSPVARPGIYNQVQLVDREVNGKGFAREVLNNFVDKVNDAYPAEWHEADRLTSFYYKTEYFLQDVLRPGVGLNAVQNMYYNALYRDLTVNDAYGWLLEPQVAKITGILMEALEEVYLKANKTPTTYSQYN